MIHYSGPNGCVKTCPICFKKKKKIPQLTKSDLKTLFHALDICNSDYSGNNDTGPDKHEMRQLKENNRVRNKLDKIQILKGW